jgi:glycosyltransferase involved in cell wall biosynthesis
MKICILTANMEHGGATIVSLDIAKGMAQKGHEVTFICAGDSNLSYRQNGYNVNILENPLKNFFFHYFNPILLFKLKKRLAVIQPDIIHVHNINLQTFSLFSLLLSRYYPLIWTLHDVWPLCVTGWPIVPDCHGLINNCNRCPSWPFWMAKLNKLIKETIYQYSKIHITTPSYWMASLLLNSTLGKKPFNIVYNGISPQFFYQRNKLSVKEKYDFPHEKKIILFCGGKKIAGQLPAERKGWEYLASAIEILGPQSKNLLLIYVGDPIKLPPNFPISVRFEGGVDREMMNDYYNIADVLVLPTLADNCPLTILEAMACKLPVIATYTGGVTEIIHDDTGLLCHPRDSIDLSKKIEYLVQNPDKADQMAERAFQRFEKKFTLSRMINEFEKIYHKAINAF